MQRARNDIADEQESEGVLPGPTSSEDGTVPTKEHAQAYNLGPPPPTPAYSPLGTEGVLRQEAVGEEVEVEPRQSHDNVKGVVLDWDDESGEGVEMHDALVV